MAKWILGAILGLLIVNEGVWLVQMHRAPEGFRRYEEEILSLPVFRDAGRLERPALQTERDAKLYFDLQDARRDFSKIVMAQGCQHTSLVRAGTNHAVRSLLLLALAVAAWIGCIRTRRRAAAPRVDVPQPGTTVPPGP